MSDQPNPLNHREDTGQPDEQQALIRQMRWRCRRGILEVELLLQPFFEHHALNLVTERRLIMEKLLACADTDLLAWFTQGDAPNEPDLADFIKEIVGFAR